VTCLKIRLLKLIDRAVGGIATAILSAPEQKTVADPHRFLLVRPGGIGDAVLLIPAILAIREQFPEAQIAVLAERRNGSVFKLCPAVDRLLFYDTPADLLRAVRGGFDVVIDTEQRHRLSAVVARLTRAPVSIGFATNDRKRLFTRQIGYSHEDYEADSFFNLLAPLGITPPAALRLPFLSVPEGVATRAEVLLEPLSSAPFVTIFPGASIAERRWGAEKFRGVAEALVHTGTPVVVVGGKDDAAAGEVVVKGAGGLNLAGKTSLVESAAVIAHSSLLISGDSGVLHMAVGLGVPTVSLFGPGIQAKWGPRGEGDLVVNRCLPCTPCTRYGTTPPCPIHTRCMAEITVDEVAAAALKMLKA
jgi:ADP-heptose:LPS heptosyltransferase